jgi:formylglycine-generating enzyme required for sulfatase activity
LPSKKDSVEALAYDMVGNVHEWVDDPAGTFLGGYTSIPI